MVWAFFQGVFNVRTTLLGRTEVNFDWSKMDVTERRGRSARRGRDDLFAMFRRFLKCWFCVLENVNGDIKPFCITNLQTVGPSCNSYLSLSINDNLC